MSDDLGPVGRTVLTVDSRATTRARPTITRDTSIRTYRAKRDFASTPVPGIAPRLDQRRVA